MKKQETLVQNGHRNGTSRVPEQRIPANVIYTDHAYHFEFLLPGISKEDIDVDVEESMITVSAQSNEDQVKYTRRFQLPKRADVEGIQAELQDGILHVQVREQEKYNRKINIQ